MILSAFWNTSAMVEVPGESQRNSRGRSGKHDCAAGIEEKVGKLDRTTTIAAIPEQS